MARRDLSNFNSVVQAVAEQPDRLMLGAAEIGEKIITAGQEAKINENLSTMQIKLNELNNQYQVENEGDPFTNRENLRKAQNQMIGSFGKDISPIFRRQFEDSARNMTARSYSANEAWAYQQTRKNTVSSINNSMKSDIGLSMSEGQNYGSNDSADIMAAINFKAGEERLREFGSKHLGEETLNEQLQNYRQDNIRAFFSGLAESNPLKALRDMDSPEVRKAFGDEEVYMKMKDAVETRALKVQDINAQKEVLGVLKNESSLLTKSLNSPLPYAQLQQEFESGNLSKPAQDYFLKINGYKKNGEDGVKLSASDQAQVKAGIYQKIAEIGKMDNPKATDVSALQDMIFTAMDKKALTEAEGVNYLTQVTQPLIGQKEKELEKFSTNRLWDDDIGFGGVQDYYEKSVKLEEPTGKDAGAKDSARQAKALNTVNQVKLYDYYMASLQGIAGSYRNGENPNGIAVGDIPAKLNQVQRNKIYSEAQNEAVRLYNLDTNPALKTLPDLPNFVFKDGQLIPGVVGSRKLDPVGQAPASFQMIKRADGAIARRYPDGRIEVIK